MPHNGAPEVRRQHVPGLIRIRFVCIGHAVIHEPEAQLGNVVIRTNPITERTRLHIGLTFTSSQKYISPATPIDHAEGDIVVLIFVAV